jgi:hypothetical protein
MRHQTTATIQATWGALAGALLVAIGLVISGMVSAGVFPLMVTDALDPVFLGHSILVLFLFGAIVGAVVGGLWVRWRLRK